MFSLRQYDTLNSLRQSNAMIFFLYVFFLAFILYKLFIYMRNFILHILTKVKNVPYIYALIFEFVFIILVF